MSHSDRRVSMIKHDEWSEFSTDLQLQKNVYLWTTATTTVTIALQGILWKTLCKENSNSTLTIHSFTPRASLPSFTALPVAILAFGSVILSVHSAVIVANNKLQPANMMPNHSQLHTRAPKTICAATKHNIRWSPLHPESCPTRF